MQAAWLGRLEPGEAGRPLNFRSVESEGSESSSKIHAMFPQWHDEPVLDASIPPLSLTHLAGMTVGRKGLAPGDVRLVASLNEPLPGMEVDPVASQATRAAVLVVANLRYAPPPEPQADYNSRQDPPPDSAPMNRLNLSRRSDFRIFWCFKRGINAAADSCDRTA